MTKAKSSKRVPLTTREYERLYAWAERGSGGKAYKHQAPHYNREALHLASTYLLRSKKVEITKAEVKAVRRVAQAWSELADLLQNKCRAN